MGKVTAELQWGILSAFPKLMPVHHDVQVFPRLFTTNNKLNLPFLPLDAESAFIGENRSLSEEGSLCFTVNPHANSFCIFLSLFSTGCFEGYRKYGAQSTNCIPHLNQDNITIAYSMNVVWLNGTWPWYQHVDNFTPPPQPKWAPTCWGSYEGESWPWTGCQSKILRWADKAKKFTFSPDVIGPDKYLQGMFQQTDLLNPFNIWMLCRVNGSCLYASSLVMLNGGSFGAGNVSCSVTEIRKKNCSGEDCQETLWVNCSCYGYNTPTIPTEHYTATQFVYIHHLCLLLVIIAYRIVVMGLVFMHNVGTLPNIALP